MSGVEARDHVARAVRRELFGPADELYVGTAVDCTGANIVLSEEQAKAFVYHNAATGQEILTKMDPLRRYGVGVLFGGGAAALSAVGDAGSGSEETPDIDTTWVSGLEVNDIDPSAPDVTFTGSVHQDRPDDDDFDLTDANSLKPSAMAISFKVRVQQGSSIELHAWGASYKRYNVTIPSVHNQAEWWLREPYTLAGTVSASSLLTATYERLVVPVAPVNADGSEDTTLHRLLPQIQLYTRPVPGESDPDSRLVTVALVNADPGAGNGHALFQNGFEVRASGGATIEPYPSVHLTERDDEERSINLLYRNKSTFAIGHGCAALWEETPDGSAAWARTDPLPSYEVVSLTPNVYLRDEHGAYLTDSDGKRRAVTVSMQELASGSDRGRKQVDLVLRLYGEWVASQRALIPELQERFHEAAGRHMDLCEEALGRMKAGWELVQANSIAARAFALANEAMLYQQLRSRLPDRKVTLTKTGQSIDGPSPVVVPAPQQGQWRPFQIAFVLATLPELVQPFDGHREIVDLIFFPTGGGKTEAYLGAAAVSLLSRRLRKPDDVGTDTLMRYTLRLLTAQQFLRAAALICVLEDIRSRAEAELGDSPFGIGIWLGRSSTPNNWKQAITALRKMKNDARQENPFLLSRCPWCGTRMGRTPDNDSTVVVGYIEFHDRVVLRCPDPDCRFGGRSRTLPVHVVDQDIYEKRPSLVIGTVDKFAMLAWTPDARSLFGLGADGSRAVSPPSLIIQDELHLISGPLGSMVGLYEPVINDLCTDYRDDEPIPPKIIASTATIRRYEDQVLGVFGRSDVSLFPPHGLEEGHSFFAEPETLDDGSPAPGRRYLGVMSGSLGSMQTVQVRVTAATLNGAASIPDEADRDGYWTNLNFLNSLRELGNTVYLLESDVPDYLTGLRFRDGLEQPRWPRVVMELTSRRRSDEIPEAIDLLKKQYGEKGCIDICLASNIIEVGVDIDRLALMTIVGQPKTTAQYIQVSGRVGRKPEVSPGLVITLYGAAKPRDRSHYERFRTYHQQLYAQVEPTSVTPFANPVLRRALHAAIIARIRQTAPALTPNPFPQAEFDAGVELLRRRAESVNAEELSAFDSLVDERRRQWSAWQRTEWSANAYGGDPLQGLMRSAGELPDLGSKATMWDVPMSMRNVDAECSIEISTAYAIADGQAQGGEQ
ncbi:helicase-related protein [Agromyces bauzanensis]